MRPMSNSQSPIRDINQMSEFLHESSGDKLLCERIVSALYAQGVKIAGTSITLGRPRADLQPNMRSMPFRKCLTFFRYAGTSVENVAIRHARRDLGACFGEADDTP